MATQVQQRRGNTTQSNAFKGASGELTVNTSNNSVRVHDGTTLGGWELLRSDLTNLSVPLPAGQPVGNTTEVQFNKAGVFGASAGLTFNDVGNVVTAANLAVTGMVKSNLNPEGNLVLSLGNTTSRWANVFTGSLEATNANLTGNLTAIGDITANGNATFYGNMAVTGSLSVGGAVFEGNDSSVIGNFTVGETLTASDANLANATIGNLTVDNLVVANLAATKLINGNSNVVVVPNAEVTISSNGVADIIRVDETGTKFALTSNFAGNVIFNQGVSITNLANLKIPGGIPNQTIKTDGFGNLVWADGGGGGGISGGFANGTSEAMIPVADGNINFSVAGTTNIVVFTGGGANFAGNLDVAGKTTVVDIEASGAVNAFAITSTTTVTAVEIIAETGTYSGNVSVAANLSANNGVFTNNVTAVNTTLTGNIKAAAGNITGNLAVGGNANIIGSMNSDTANVIGNAIIGNVSTGVLTANTANIAGNLTAGNANLGNLATANFFSGDGSLLTNVPVTGQFSMNFSYANTSPLNTVIIPTGKTVTSATVVVVTPFDGVTSKLSLGTVANANSILATTDILATVNGTYTAYPAVRYGANTQLVLGIIPGTSTQGDGVLVINYI